MNEISVELNGVLHEASYEVIGDTLIVFLPDGSQRQTTLNGNLKPKTTAIHHLRAFAHSKISPLK